MCRLSVSVHQNMSALLPKRRVKEIVLLTVTLAVFTHCITINKVGHPEIVAKTRVAIRPIIIHAFLNDIIRISAPVINEESVYYLNKPNGDVMKLDIKSPKLRHLQPRQEELIVARFIKDMKPIICQENNNDVYALPPKDDFQKKLEFMEENDFLIGPLTIEDHGNWMLSVYTKDFNGDWIELFQDISVTITEYVPLRPSKQTLNLGEALNVSIAFPIPDLESCELVAPRSTFDRLFDRNRMDMDACGFSIPNITVEDAGTWKIIAVGKMVYEGEMNLNVNHINSTNAQIVID